MDLFFEFNLKQRVAPVPLVALNDGHPLMPKDVNAV
jgi:hypothetical protein